MPEPDKPPCPICQGAEVIFLEDTTEADVEPCRCLKARLLRQHLGPEIASSPTILRSPLFVVENDEVKVDRTKENLFIRAGWPDLLPHLKWAFYCKGTRFRFQIVTDEKIRTVFVGDESYRNRAKGRRDDVVTMNSLNDLVGPDYNLVIIRLGYLGYKNVAAPGALKEALMLRETACLPTWLVLDLGMVNEFHECHSYADDVSFYIDQRYKKLGIGQTVPRQPAPVQEEYEASEDISATEDPSMMAPPPRVVRSRPEPAAVDVDVSVAGGDREYSPKKRGKRSGGGEGPV